MQGGLTRPHHGGVAMDGDHPSMERETADEAT